MKRTLLIIFTCIIAIPFLLIAGYLSYSYSVGAYARQILKKAAPDAVKFDSQTYETSNGAYDAHFYKFTEYNAEYTKDWETISREYRESHNFTCEECGITIEDPFDRQFIQVHHINGDKTDNSPNNLKCLCIHCHANVDDTHRKNFNRRANAMLLDGFNRKYGNHINNEDNHFDLPF